MILIQSSRIVPQQNNILPCKTPTWELPSLCQVWVQTEHLEKVFGEVVALLLPQDTGCNGFTLCGVGLSPCPHTGKTCPTTQPCCHLLPWGFVTSCPTEGVLIAGVAHLEGLRRRRVLRKAPGQVCVGR